ncbi:MAG: hypothetical protein MUF64_06160 [Polyangiaceae bacterium]|jgi:hypothetical protein|nr:hypothetical protein [Polyangiaceae bacterium]
MAAMISIVLRKICFAISGTSLLGCGANLHTTPWIDAPRGELVASLGRSAGQQAIVTERPTPEESLFRQRRVDYTAWNAAISYRPVLSRRTQLGLSLSPVALDLKIVMLEAPVTVSVLPRWTLLNVSEGMNLEMPLLVGWRSRHIDVFGGAGPRWMIPSELIKPSYGDRYERRVSELEGRLSAGVRVFVWTQSAFMVEATRLWTIKGKTDRETFALNLGHSWSW